MHALLSIEKLIRSQLEILKESLYNLYDEV